MMDDPLEVENQELQPLEFSEPECGCESTAPYTNPQGQEFEVRVRGANPDLVLEYVKEVQIFMEVVPLVEETPEEESPEQDEKYRYLVEALYREVQLQPELDLQIDLEIVDTLGVEEPCEWNIGIDPGISGGQTHFYRAKVKAKKIKVNMSASQNGVSGYLSGGGVSLRDQADTYSPDPPKKKARFRGEAGGQSQFYFSVTGLRNRNKYSFGSSIKMVR